MPVPWRQGPNVQLQEIGFLLVPIRRFDRGKMRLDASLLGERLDTCV